MSKKKRKKQRYIAKIISDGKVSQKEAKRAVKKGISLGRIQNAQTKSFIPDNVYSNARLSRESSRQAPTQFDADVTLPRRYSNNIAKSYQQEHGGLGTYSPLKMKGKVRSIFDKPVAAAPQEVDPPETETQEQPLTSDYVEEANTTLDEADTRYEDLLNQFKIFQEAAAERNRLAQEAQRRQMITMQRRDRAAGRAPTLQLRGAGEFGKGGSQGFRRRADQFRINPFRNLGGIMGAVGAAGQGIANNMVNI